MRHDQQSRPKTFKKLRDECARGSRTGRVDRAENGEKCGERKANKRKKGDRQLERLLMQVPHYSCLLFEPLEGFIPILIPFGLMGLMLQAVD